MKMTVGELRKKLEEFDQNLPVYCSIDDGDMSSYGFGSDISVNNVGGLYSLYFTSTEQEAIVITAERP